MIALIALIAAVIILGGGVEFLRRARFGVGPSAAHHRALDRLGHITTQSADSKTELVTADEPEVLSHVRKAVESDRAQPRIEPQPVSRPVAVPAITGGPNFVGTIPAGQVSGRGPDTEIEGVRVLRPDPDPDEVAPGEGDDSGVEVSDDELLEGADATSQLALPLEGEHDDWDDAEWHTDDGWPVDDDDRLHVGEAAPAGGDGVAEPAYDPLHGAAGAGWSAAAQRWASDAPSDGAGVGDEPGWSPAGQHWEQSWAPEERGWEHEGEAAALAWPEPAPVPGGEQHPVWGRDEAAPWPAPEETVGEPMAAEPHAAAGGIEGVASPVPHGEVAGAIDANGHDGDAGSEQQPGVIEPPGSFPSGPAGWEPVLHAGVGSLGGPFWEDHAAEAPAAWYEESPDFDEAHEGSWAHDDQAPTPLPEHARASSEDLQGDATDDTREQVLDLDDLAGGDRHGTGPTGTAPNGTGPNGSGQHGGEPQIAQPAGSRAERGARVGGARVVRIDDLGRGDGAAERNAPGDAGVGAGESEPPTAPVARLDDQDVARAEASDVDDAPDTADRVIRIDDLGESGWVGERTPYADEVVGGGWAPDEDRASLPRARRGRRAAAKGASGEGDAPPTAGADERPSRDRGSPSEEEAVAEETGADPADGGDAETGEPIAMRFDDLGGPQAAASGDAPELRPQHVSAGPGRQSGAIPGLTPDETRAQLAALAQSGGMGAVPGTARRRHRRRRSGEGRHHLASAAMLVAAVVIFGGAVYLVTAGSSSGGHPHRAPTAAQTPAGTAPTPTTTAPPAASLVSQSSTTATYQVSGSPTIELTFNSSCWTQVRQGSSSGPLLFEGIESSGATRQLTGPVWVRLGNPTAVSVSVGGTTVAQPAISAGTPYNLQFQ